MKNLIIGAGEIGKSLYEVFKPHHETYIRDVDNLEIEGIEVLNICYPYSKNFVKITKDYIKQYKPKVVIIHSTVKPGTAKLLNAVHSPCHGKHPNLVEGIKTFVKYVGGDNIFSVYLADKFLKQAGIKTKLVANSKTSELSKIFCTSYYGWNILFMKEVAKICEKEGVPFQEVYIDWNWLYNMGYEKLGSPHFRRPVLEPMDEKGLKGHCVLENAIILKEYTENSLSDIILSAGKNEETIKEEKPYLNKTWFYCEYWGKKRTLKDIGEQFGVSGENIQQIAKRKGWEVRSNKWTEKDVENVIKLYKEGKTFKEISDYLENKDYSAVRNLVHHRLKLKSNYKPGEETKKIENRKKISAKLQGIDIEKWNGFKETENKIIRKSIKCQNWRDKIFKRDNYTCQNCNKKGGFLNAHHIKPFSKYPELRFDINNGIALCRECHLKTNLHKEK